MTSVSSHTEVAGARASAAPERWPVDGRSALKGVFAAAARWRVPLLVVIIFVEMLVGYLLVALDVATPPGDIPPTEPVIGMHPGVLLVAIVYTCGLGILAGLLLLFLPRSPTLVFVASCVLMAASGLVLPATIALVVITASADRKRLALLLSGYGVAVLAGSYSPLGQSLGVRLFVEHAAGWAALAVRAMILVIVVIGVFLIRSSRHVEELERARARRAEEQRAQMVDTAILAERNRIAREMHDAIGHKLSLVALHAGSMQLRETDSERRASITVIREAATTAMSELREVLGVLRGDVVPDRIVEPAGTFAEIDALVDESRSAGIRISYRPESRTIEFSPELERIVYRIVQEGLTNIHRHAPASTADLAIRLADSKLVIRLANDVAPTFREPVATIGLGTGLAGIAERARQCGGHADWQLSSGVWVLTAVLPVHESTGEGEDA